MITTTERTSIGDLHAEDPISENAANRTTKSGLTLLTKDQLEAAKSKLNDLLERQNRVIEDETEKKGSVADNLAALSDSPVKVPDPGLPNIREISRTLSTVFSEIRTNDVQNIRSAISLSRQARDPSTLTNFEQEMASLIQGRIAMKITDLSRSIADINGMIVAIDEVLTNQTFTVST